MGHIYIYMYICVHVLNCHSVSLEITTQFEPMRACALNQAQKASGGCIGLKDSNVPQLAAMCFR